MINFMQILYWIELFNTLSFSSHLRDVSAPVQQSRDRHSRARLKS